MKLLRGFFRLAVTPSDANVSGIRRPLGHQQILNATLAASVGIVIPAAPVVTPIGLARIQSNGGTVRWRDDGTAPTSSVGFLLADGATVEYTGDFSAIRFIASTGTPILDIALYA